MPYVFLYGMVGYRYGEARHPGPHSPLRVASVNVLLYLYLHFESLLQDVDLVDGKLYGVFHALPNRTPSSLLISVVSVVALLSFISAFSNSNRLLLFYNRIIRLFIHIDFYMAFCPLITAIQFALCQFTVLLGQMFIKTLRHLVIHSSNLSLITLHRLGLLLYLFRYGRKCGYFFFSINFASVSFSTLV